LEPQEPERFTDPDNVNIDVDGEEDDIDSDEAFGESDSERFENFKFGGSTASRKIAKDRWKRKTAADFMTDSEEEDLGVESVPIVKGASKVIASDEEADDNSDGSESLEPGGKANGVEEPDSGLDVEDGLGENESESDESRSEEQVHRAEIRKIMAEEQKAIVATISQAAKVDVEKGRAVKQQRTAFDSLLNARIRLQKGLIAINSMGVSEQKDVDTARPYEAAEEAAIKLLNTLDVVRQELEKGNSSAKTGTKRKTPFDTETPSSAIWQRLQDSESLAIGNRQVTLEKWSAKVRDTTALPIFHNKLNNVAPTQSIISVLQDQLSNSERLVKRTRTPRSCAPLQAKLKIAEDPSIYDDADFYQLLLKELIDQRMTDPIPTGTGLSGVGERPVAQWAAAREAKTKKNVDTRASKGRKLRYTVHEKLQNFMAPEDRGTWEQEAVDRFFGSLLGRKLDLGEEMEDGADDDDTPMAEEALMLFRS
jgi:protein AATF/BFR2